jgi:hypothetical protein
VSTDALHPSQPVTRSRGTGAVDLARTELRAGGIAGILFVLLTFVWFGVFAAEGHLTTLDSTVDDITAAYSTPATAAVWAAAYLKVIGHLLFIPFAVTLHRILRREGAPSDWWTVVGLVTACVFVAANFAAFAAGGALEHRAGPGLDPGMATALSDFVGFGYVITWAVAAVILAVSAVLVRWTSALPGWVGWSAAAIAILLLVAVGAATSPAAQFPMLLFSVWVLAVSVVLLRRSVRR